MFGLSDYKDGLADWERTYLDNMSLRVNVKIQGIHMKSLFQNSKLGWFAALLVVSLNIIGAGLYFFKNYVPSEPEDPNFPVPQLIAPDTVTLGDIVDLSIKPYGKEKPAGLVSVTVDWKVFDQDKLVKLRFNPDGSVFFPSGTTNKSFEVLAGVASHYIVKDDKTEAAVIKSYVLKKMVVVGNGPVPPPNPPTPPTPPVPPQPVILPDGKYKLSQFTYDNAMKLVKDDKIVSRKDAAQVLAKNFGAVAASIAAGVDKTSEDALKKLTVMNQKELKGLGVDLGAWDAFFVELQERLYRIDDDNTFGNSVMNLRDAFVEIKLGFEAVK